MLAIDGECMQHITMISCGLIAFSLVATPKGPPGGPPVVYDSRSPLYELFVESTAPSSFKIITLYIRDESIINQADSDGNGPLHWAVSFNYPFVVQILSGLGADIEHKNKVGLAPLGFAIQNRNQRAVASLLAAGASLGIPERKLARSMRNARPASDVQIQDSKDIFNFLRVYRPTIAIQDQSWSFSLG